MSWKEEGRKDLRGKGGSSEKGKKPSGKVPASVGHLSSCKKEVLTHNLEHLQGEKKESQIGEDRKKKVLQVERKEKDSLAIGPQETSSFTHLGE